MDKVLYSTVSGVVNITGGKITGKGSAINAYSSSATINISNATLTAPSYYSWGAGVITLSRNAVLNINSGTIDCTGSGYAIFQDSGGTGYTRIAGGETLIRSYGNKAFYSKPSFGAQVNTVTVKTSESYNGDSLRSYSSNDYQTCRYFYIPVQTF